MTDENVNPQKLKIHFDVVVLTKALSLLKHSVAL